MSEVNEKIERIQASLSKINALLESGKGNKMKLTVKISPVFEAEQKRIELRDQNSEAYHDFEIADRNVLDLVLSSKLWLRKPTGTYLETYNWLMNNSKSKKLHAACFEAIERHADWVEAKTQYQNYLDRLELKQNQKPVLLLVHSVAPTGYERLRANVEKHMGSIKTKSVERTRNASQRAMYLCKKGN